MRGSTHIAVGASFGVLAGRWGIVLTPLDWTMLFLGSLAPDLDAGQALISRPSRLLVRFIPRALGAVFDATFLTLSFITNKLFGHRGALHWPSVGLVLLGFGWAQNIEPLIWFSCGYLLHIGADFCTKSGVPLFGPFHRERIAWSPLRTGSYAENLLAAALWSNVMWNGYFLLPEITREWFSFYAERAGALICSHDNNLQTLRTACESLDLRITSDFTGED